MNRIRDVTGTRGEKLAELRLTQPLPDEPAFSVAGLGEKWPVIDHYVEFFAPAHQGMFFFVQVKSTRMPLRGRSLSVQVPREDVVALKNIRAPTYVIGVHEPSGRVFARAVHAQTRHKGISGIPLSHELDSNGLQMLRDEVLGFWTANPVKPESSRFA